MLFTSVQFLVFFVAVFAIYWALPWQKARIIFLLAASYYFYMSWNAKLAAVVAGSSVVDFYVARALEMSTIRWRRKAILALSIVMNLGLLSYFKYMNFFLESLGQLLHGVGLNAHMPMLEVLLPIGISFYTFEAISYTVDVYLKRAEAEKNPLHFLLFITFFPRMVAGPIIRAKNFLPQLKRAKTFDWGRFDLGLQYVLMGLFKKMAIADRMAYLSDPVYANPSLYSTAAAWTAVGAYSLQLYCDFSGYSDIALGVAHMLGFKLPVNFNMPYASKNISEFWRRWHISLSTWIRDYLFIPLGGSRGTAARTAVTLIVTMTLCGLWHGAKWTFVLWGTAQALMMIVHRMFRNYCKPRAGLREKLESPWGAGARVAVTYSAFALSLVIFRAVDFPSMGAVFHALFIPQGGGVVSHPVDIWSLVMAGAIVITAHIAVERQMWKKLSLRFSPVAWGCSYAALFFLICLLTPRIHQAFIYFQF